MSKIIRDAAGNPIGAVKSDPSESIYKVRDDFENAHMCQDCPFRTTETMLAYLFGVRIPGKARPNTESFRQALMKENWDWPCHMRENQVCVGYDQFISKQNL